jgi:hypothetical protein
MLKLNGISKNTLVALTLIALFGCSETKFHGNGKKKSNSTEAPKCNEIQTSTGINLTLLIDNSNSNAKTDCPDPKSLGQFRNTRTESFECQGQTNREIAASAAVDMLNSYRKDLKGFVPELAIASFPNADEVTSGFDIRTDDWLTVEDNSKDAVSKAMEFSRRPVGSTPYQAAMSAGIKLFNQMKDSTVPRLALLVTDGEPTDENAVQAKAVAKELRDLGVKIVTIFVTGNATRESRTAQHIQYLQNEGYSAANIDELMGRNGKKSLVDELSDEKIEVADSKELEEVFKSVIKKSVECKK